MKITVIGTGYVGLVAGTCLAEIGNKVTCIDIDKKKIDRLNQGKITIYEPGLEPIFERNLLNKRLSFSHNLLIGVHDADVIFLALPTPPDKDGSADLQYVLKVADEIAPLLENYTVIVNKSTVPVGTAGKVSMRIAARTNVPFDVVSNPEFLKEGVAVGDFMQPDRIVIGSSSSRAINIMKEIYRPISEMGYPVLIMDEKSAELTKYAANAFLATKISFVNEIANLCENLDANIDSIRQGIGLDKRIGNKFLNAGIGYGGSCFPKDVKALVKAADQVAYDFKILKAVEEINNKQKLKLVEKCKEHFNFDLIGLTVAMWGLSFKPNTDDIREAPSIQTIRALLKEGARIKAFDPVAMENIRQLFTDECNSGKLMLCQNEYEAADNADALMIMTEWSEFKQPEINFFKHAHKQPVIFDGRNILDPDIMKIEGLDYYSIGRKVVKHASPRKVNHETGQVYQGVYGNEQAS